MKNLKKVLAVILAFAMMFCSVSVASVAADDRGEAVASLPFVTISDIHLYPESLMGNRSEAWMQFCRLESKCFNESEAILRNALDNLVERAKDSGLKYVLLSGDLTKDSEYEAHVTLANILKEYQDKYGLQFLVTVGNHDINNEDACTFENDVKEPTRAITAAEFPEIYSEFGYADAIDRYAYPENGDEVQGALSYVYDLDDNYRLISVDSAIYDFGTTPQQPVTAGTVSDELNEWIKSWTEKTYAEGKTPFIMVHHNMAPHMEVEPSITQAFVLNNYLDVAEKWASWGINYTFSGHLHTNDTATVTTDDGDTLYDLESDSLTGFPNEYRENVISTYADGSTSMYTDSVDFDSDVQFTFDGVTYDNGTYKNHSFSLCFGGGIAEDGKANITDFLVGTIKVYLGEYLTNIADAGGIVNFLKDSFDLDVEKIIANFLSPYIGDGIKVGSKTVFSVDNIMWFINDLDKQITETYIDNPDKLYDILTDAISQLAEIQVSDVPCTRFIDTLGFGDENKGGTLNDLVLSAMYYWYTGNEDAENDEFLMSACENLAQGDLTKELFNDALDIIINDIVLDNLLSNVDLHLEALLKDSTINKVIKQQINNLGKLLLKNDLSYTHIIKVFFALEILPYNNVIDALYGYLLDEYLTDSQFEGTGTFIAYVLKDFSCDSDPSVGDYDVTYYSDKVVPEATQANYRIPTDIAVTIGEDAETSANISFYTKSTLQGDIEIYKADSEPEFKGAATTTSDFNIDISTETVTRSYPGIDIGVFGLFTYEYPINQTKVKLTGLEPDSTYYYRVGNAEHGWWSETGTITTADGSNDVTFIHTADPQSQTTDQYTRSWAKVLETAYKTYPDTDFSLNTGDLVDHGDNSKQWSMMFDTAASTLTNTYLMPASGNHEGKGTNSTANYFVLPNVPDQDTTTGVYYSFDYNNVHIAVLNTNDLNDDDALTDTQINWLKNDMNTSDAEWKFVAIHKAIYSNGSHYDDDDVCAIRDQLSTLMPELGIDMVFQGHDHVYLRTGVMANNEVVSTDTQYVEYNGAVYKGFESPTGTIYAISGTAGVKTYLVKDNSATDELFPRAEKMMAVDAPMFSAVEIKDGVLYFTAYTVTDDGEANPVDRIAIVKDASQTTPAENQDEAQEESENESLISKLKTFWEKIVKVFTVIKNLLKVAFVGVDK